MEKQPTEVLLCHLFSAPLTQDSSDGDVQVEELDHAGEREALIKTLQEANKRVAFLSVHAELDTLRRAVSCNVGTPCRRVMHFTGHGVAGKLVLEDGRGRLVYATSETLREMVSGGTAAAGLDLIFVSACFSESVAGALVAAGVPHVVAVSRSTKIHDKRAQEFARSFYAALLRGDTVRQAFELAKDRLDVVGEEAHSQKFRLLPENAAHSERPLFNVADGPFIPISRPPAPSGCDEVSEHFTGRSCEVQRLYAFLADNGGKRRRIYVTGPRGIGKTQVCLAACEYERARGIFAETFFCRLGDAAAEAAATGKACDVRFALQDGIGIAEPLPLEASAAAEALATWFCRRAGRAAALEASAEAANGANSNGAWGEFRRCVVGARGGCATGSCGSGAALSSSRSFAHRRDALEHGGARLLLLLDGAPRIAAFGDEAVAMDGFLAKVVAKCPNLTVLITTAEAPLSSAACAISTELAEVAVGPLDVFSGADLFLKALPRFLTTNELRGVRAAAADSNTPGSTSPPVPQSPQQLSHSQHSSLHESPSNGSISDGGACEDNYDPVRAFSRSEIIAALRGHPGATVAATAWLSLRLTNANLLELEGALLCETIPQLLSAFSGGARQQQQQQQHALLSSKRRSSNPLRDHSSAATYSATGTENGRLLAASAVGLPPDAGSVGWADFLALSAPAGASLNASAPAPAAAAAAAAALAINPSPPLPPRRSSKQADSGSGGGHARHTNASTSTDAPETAEALWNEVARATRHGLTGPAEGLPDRDGDALAWESLADALADAFRARVTAPTRGGLTQEDLDRIGSTATLWGGAPPPLLLQQQGVAGKEQQQRRLSSGNDGLVQRRHFMVLWQWFGPVLATLEATDWWEKRLVAEPGLGDKEARRRLAGRRVGTFLARFGTRAPGTLVLSYVKSNHDVVSVQVTIARQDRSRRREPVLRSLVGGEESAFSSLRALVMGVADLKYLYGGGAVENDKPKAVAFA